MTGVSISAIGLSLLFIISFISVIGGMAGYVTVDEPLSRRGIGYLTLYACGWIIMLSLTT